MLGSRASPKPEAWQLTRRSTVKHCQTRKPIQGLAPIVRCAALHSFTVSGPPPRQTRGIRITGTTQVILPKLLWGEVARQDFARHVETLIEKNGGPEGVSAAHA